MSGIETPIKEAVNFQQISKNRHPGLDPGSMLLEESPMFIGLLAWIPDQVRDDGPKKSRFPTASRCVVSQCRNPVV
jgi:hypothetical protein